MMFRLWISLRDLKLLITSNGTMLHCIIAYVTDTYVHTQLHDYNNIMTDTSYVQIITIHLIKSKNCT